MRVERETMHTREPRPREKDNYRTHIEKRQKRRVEREKKKGGQ